MKASWLVAYFGNGRDIVALDAAVRGQGLRSKIVRAVPFGDSSHYDDYPTDDCVVFYGPANLTANIASDGKWIPGAWLDAEQLACHSFYPRLDKFLIHPRHTILPFHQLADREEELFTVYGVNDRVFLRPDSTLKVFESGLVTRQQFRELVQRVSPVVDGKCGAVIGTPVEIASEYRSIIRKGKYVAGTRYKSDGQVAPSPEVPSEVVTFAEEAARFPFVEAPPVYVLDVAAVNADDGSIRYRVLEIGSVNSSGLYECNLAEVVRAVSEEAAIEYEQRGASR